VAILRLGLRSQVKPVEVVCLGIQVLFIASDEIPTSRLEILINFFCERGGGGGILVKYIRHLCVFACILVVSCHNLVHIKFCYSMALISICWTSTHWLCDHFIPCQIHI